MNMSLRDSLKDVAMFPFLVTSEVLKAFNDLRLHLISMSESRNFTSASLLFLMSRTGEWIIPDADNVLSTRKTSLLMNLPLLLPLLSLSHFPTDTSYVRLVIKTENMSYN